MSKVHYPAVLYTPGADGWWAVTIPGINVNAQGRTRNAALIEAADILQEVIDDLTRDGEPVPEPGEPDDEQLRDGSPAVIQASMPAVAA